MTEPKKNDKQPENSPEQVELSEEEQKALIAEMNEMAEEVEAEQDEQTEQNNARQPEEQQNNGFSKQELEQAVATAVNAAVAIEREKAEAQQKKAVRDAKAAAGQEVKRIQERAKKDIAAAGDKAVVKFAKKLFDLADTFQHALQNMPEGSDQDPKIAPVIEGIKGLGEQLQDIFNDQGIEKIEALGQPFDPNIHQAMIQVDATEEFGPGTVAKVMQDGYQQKLDEDKTRVIRPARVAVVKKP